MLIHLSDHHCSSLIAHHLLFYAFYAPDYENCRIVLLYCLHCVHKIRKKKRPHFNEKEEADEENKGWRIHKYNINKQQTINSNNKIPRTRKLIIFYF